MGVCFEGGGCSWRGGGRRRAVYIILCFSGFKDFKIISGDQIVSKNKKGGKYTHSFGSCYACSDSDTNPDVQVVQSYFKKGILKNLALCVIWICSMNDKPEINTHCVYLNEIISIGSHFEMCNHEK